MILAFPVIILIIDEFVIVRPADNLQILVHNNSSRDKVQLQDQKHQPQGNSHQVRKQDSQMHANEHSSIIGN